MTLLLFRHFYAGFKVFLSSTLNSFDSPLSIHPAAFDAVEWMSENSESFVTGKRKRHSLNRRRNALILDR
jgi:hypothetical protein